MEQLPGLSDRDILEGMSQEAILQQIQVDLGRIASIKERISLASDVLVGAYGVDIDLVLEERANETKITST